MDENKEEIEEQEQIEDNNNLYSTSHEINQGFLQFNSTSGSNDDYIQDRLFLNN